MGSNKQSIQDLENRISELEKQLNDAPLTKSETRFRELFENMNTGFVLFKVVLDEKGKPIDLIIVMANKEFEITTGLILKDVIGKRLTHVLPGIENDPADWIGIYGKIALTGKSQRFENESQLLGYYYNVNAYQPEPKHCAVTFLNITKTKQAERKLKESEDYLRNTINVSPNIISKANLKTGYFIDTNDAVTRILGYTVEEFTSRPLIDFVHKDDHQRTTHELSRLLKGKRLVLFENRYLCKDGSYKWIAWVSSTPNEEGIIIANGTDVTERKQLEEERKKFVMLADSSSEFIGMCDLNLQPIYVNNAGMRMVGLSNLEAACQVKVQDYFFPEDQKFIAEEFFPRVMREGHGDVEIRLRHFQTGEPIWMYYYLYAVRNFNNETIGWATVSRDITEQRQAKILLEEKSKELQVSYEELEAQNEELEVQNEEFRQINEELSRVKKRAEENSSKLIAALDSMADAVFISDAQGNIINVNDAYIKITNFNHIDELVKDFSKYPLFFDVYFINGDVASTEMWAVPRALRGETAINELYIIQRKDGSEKWIGSYNFAPIKNKKEEIVGCVVTIRDVTEKLKQEKELIKAKEKAEESDRLKSAFLAAMSHELRTPLNAIIGFSGLIDKNLPIEDIVQYCKTINSSGNHLLDIVKDLFDITLIEAGQVNLSEEKTNLNMLLQEVHQIISVEQQKQKKNLINLNLSVIEEYNDLVINTDPSKLKQILINLLKNALKFTHKGQIKYGFEIEATMKNQDIKFFVKDTGIGIPKEKHEEIFGSFRQVDETHTRVYGGTGIGLSISKKLTKILGGNIWLESKVDKGTTFYFTIPMLILEEGKTLEDLKSERVVKGISGFQNKTILVVEDDDASYDYLEVILGSHDVEILRAKDGSEAIRYCKEEPTIDLLLMDINMPVMNGIIATKKIKEFRPKLPIIAQTAYAIAGDKEKAFEAGCDDYVSKPIEKSVLLEKIVKYLG